MTRVLPLLGTADAGTVLAWREGRAATAAGFIDAATALAARLPPGAPVLNLCGDRLAFALGLAAAMIARRVTWLPASTAPLALRRLAAGPEAPVCLTDGAAPEGMATVAVDAERAFTTAGGGALPVPMVEAALPVARLHTSGSTGAPVAHEKTWGMLTACLTAGAGALRLPRGGSIVATVPSQHLYGLELAILMPLLTGNALCARTPLHAAEVAAALDAVPRPRVLATTPVHLRALLASRTAYPAVDLLVSSTAPLSAALARDSEERFGAPLMEIYGSTETGQIAARRTAREEEYTPWPGIELTADEEGRWYAAGGHLATPVALQDAIESRGSRRFRLLGRRGDLVNVAGRRSSLGYLNHALLDVPGVVDGAFVAPPGDTGPDGEVARLAALVVAPGLSPRALLDALRLRIDPAFLPRPLLMVEALPRNATGKLPWDAVRGLLEAAANGAEAGAAR